MIVGMTPSPTVDAPGSVRVANRPVLWLMFFVISFGLGYPTLNRYNPNETGGVWDSRQYFRLVVDGPATAEGHWRYRILVPYLAKPVYLMARGHIGTWNPVSFSMLVINSAFCGASALLLMLIARKLGLSFATGLIAALAYLANFVVANLQLAGLVDSAECFLTMCLFLVCLERRWYLLPVIGILGALAKETVLPVAFLFLAGWFLRAERRPWIWMAVMAIAALATVTLVRSVVEGHLITPLAVAAGERNIHSLRDIYLAARSIVTDWAIWITFLWMLPLAVPGRDRLPAQAGMATLLGVICALGLSLWNWAHAFRPIFNVAAPYVCLAFAVGATRLSFGPPETMLRKTSAQN